MLGKCAPITIKREPTALWAEIINQSARISAALAATVARTRKMRHTNTWARMKSVPELFEMRHMPDIIC
jgi:hypothetical protein